MVLTSRDANSVGVACEVATGDCTFSDKGWYVATYAEKQAGVFPLQVGERPAPPRVLCGKFSIVGESSGDFWGKYNIVGKQFNIVFAQQYCIFSIQHCSPADNIVCWGVGYCGVCARVTLER